MSSDNYMLVRKVKNPPPHVKEQWIVTCEFESDVDYFDFKADVTGRHYVCLFCDREEAFSYAVEEYSEYGADDMTNISVNYYPSKES